MSQQYFRGRDPFPTQTRLQINSYYRRHNIRELGLERGWAEFHTFQHRYPWFSLNGANPVVVLTLLFSANSTIGHLAAQSLWLSWMIILRISPIEWFSHSVAPSICEWNTVDMSSLVPMSLCSSCQNVDMNLVSQSNTIDLGTLWSLMTSLRNSQATSLAVTCVVVGTKCTFNMSPSMITKR